MSRAGKPRLELKFPAFTQFLAEGVRPQLEEAGSRVQSGIPAHIPSNVRVSKNEKGRLAAVVTIVHPSGIARQIKSGVLTRPAARAGLDVKRYRV